MTRLLCAHSFWRMGSFCRVSIMQHNGVEILSNRSIKSSTRSRSQNKTTVNACTESSDIHIT